MQHFGEICSMSERRADAAGYDVLDWLKCEYVQDRVGDDFDGTIASVTGLPQLASFFVFVIIFDGIFGLYLLRKIWHYRSEYRAVDAGKQAQSAELADGGPNEP
jgi:exoribonuclease R